MKFGSFIASTVLAAASFSASATTYNLGPFQTDGFHTITSGTSEFAAGTNIDDTFTFRIDTPSWTSFAATQTFASAGGKILNFTATLMSTSLSTPFGAPSFDSTSQTLSWGGVLAAGNYMVNIKGLTQSAGAAYSTTVSATPVPEPETYGMMLGGLALVGAIARRKVTTRKA